MAITVINHVQNDLRPKKALTITDENENPVDFTALAGLQSVRMHMRVTGGAFKATVPCTLLSGLVLDDGSVNTAPPYNVAGKGGRIQVEWTAGAVDTAGLFEGEVELVFGDGTTQTTFKVIPINIREQIA